MIFILFFCCACDAPCGFSTSASRMGVVNVEVVIVPEDKPHPHFFRECRSISTIKGEIDIIKLHKIKVGSDEGFGLNPESRTKICINQLVLVRLLDGLK